MLSLEKVQLGHLAVTKFIIGSNPFSGFSHQSLERDAEMSHYYSVTCIKETLRHAEDLGITTLLARADHHIMRLLQEYWDDGGAIQWLAQTCPELGSISQGINNGIRGGAKACYLHGGQMDYLFAGGQLEQVPACIAQIHDAGLAAGIAGHNPAIFAWAEEHLEVDFYMCSYYNPSSRAQQAQHLPGIHESFDDEDRDVMAATIAQLSKPVIHYKVFAAGRKTPQQAFSFVARHLRQQDAVCVGVFMKDNPRMLEENLHVLDSNLQVGV